MYGPVGSQVPSDFVIQLGKVITSSVKENAPADEQEGLLYSVSGVPGVEYTNGVPSGDFDDSAGERNEAAETFGQLGVLARPLPPASSGGRDYFSEVVCLRQADGLVPIAHRDTRISMGGDGPGEGTIAIVGYGGGFHALDPVNDGDDGTIHTIYCPYDYTGSVAGKAHVITLDPTSGNESISIVHAEGMAITMVGSDKNLTLKNSDGSATITIDDDGITMTGQITLAGGVVIGNPSTAVPMLAAAASPPCSTLFVSP